ncbi:MAG: galactokinase [Planctomycetota bacterium]
MDLTCDVNGPSSQLVRAVVAFEQRFGHPPTHAVSAPGRVNLIGEHTDYNGGFVLPLAIQRQSVLVARVRDDRRVRLGSTTLPGVAVLDLDQPILQGEPPWSGYLRGVIARWMQGHELPHGFDALLDSHVPLGGGLSSSASITVAMTRLLEAFTGTDLDGKQRALMAHWAEHGFVGMPCGIMDPFACSLGRADHALLIDCRSREVTAVPLPPGVAVLVINSNKTHELVGGEYAVRREQCEAAAKQLGVPALRDADMRMLEAAADKLDDVTYRRARHVITENQRTLATVDALRRGDWSTIGQCMFASHRSMRDDFEITTPELDALVDAASCFGKTTGPSDGGLIGSRMTGGGFGGCTVSLVKAEVADRVGAEIASVYKRKFGVEASVFTTKAAGGTCELEL